MNITVQDLRGTIEIYWQGYSAQQRDELAAFDALAAKAARTDALEAENAALRNTLTGRDLIIDEAERRHAALVKERDQAEAEMSRLARVVADHNSPIEIRDDGVRVRKDRWETGFRNIVTIVRGPRGGFEIDEIVEHIRTLAQTHPVTKTAPIDMVLHCPKCGAQHIDGPEKVSDDRPVIYADTWTNPPHRSHLCHGCGHIWRPADVPTNGVAAVKTKGKDDHPVTKAASDGVEE